jgi:hypothetical protein
MWAATGTPQPVADEPLGRVPHAGAIGEAAPRLPMNTSGGRLGAGRLHGVGFALEAVAQLRGNGGARQIAGAPELAIATSGGGPMAAALLLAKD